MNFKESKAIYLQIAEVNSNYEARGALILYYSCSLRNIDLQAKRALDIFVICPLQRKLIFSLAYAWNAFL